MLHPNLVRYGFILQVLDNPYSFSWPIWWCNMKFQTARIYIYIYVLEDAIHDSKPCPKSKAIPYGAGETYRWSRSHIPNRPGSVYSFIHSTSAKSVYSNLIAVLIPPSLYYTNHVPLSLPPIALSSRFQAPFKFAQAQFAKTTMPLTRVHSTLLIWLPRESNGSRENAACVVSIYAATLRNTNSFDTTSFKFVKNIEPS